MNHKIAAIIFALPIGVASLMAKSASAEVATTLSASQVPMVVAQRYDDRRNDLRQKELRQEALLRETFRRNQIQREQAQRNQIQRNSFGRVWVAGHYEPGFLGIGRKWVEGHWENRR